MDRDRSDRQERMWNPLPCGCRRVCSCKCVLSSDDDGGRSKQYSPTADHWPSSPCKPWIPSWFDSPKAPERSQETERASGDKQHGKMVMPPEGTIYPTQAMRTHRNAVAVPNNPILPPSYRVVGHPSLKIYRFRLPYHLLQVLDKIVDGCQGYAANLSTGWM